MLNESRRRFLQDTLLASAAAALAGTTTSFAAEADAATPSKSANEQLRFAIIGVNGRGGSHCDGFRTSERNPDTVVTIICDADEKVGRKKCNELAKKQKVRPKYVKDMRHVFDNKEIDCVSTATPNHWHALTSIWAMQAGKDVYVEKPVSHNVSEGRRMVEVARKYNRICQAGTQSRSNPGMQQLIACAHDGTIGEVTESRGLCYKTRRSIGPRSNYPIPTNIDYNLWSGPAPIEPLTRPKLHYDWHWVWTYGNGDLGNQGIHQMDIARWGLGVNELSKGVISYGGRFGYTDAGDTANTQVIVHDYGPKTLVFEVRGLQTQDYKGARVGVVIYGSEGFVVATSYEGGVVYDKNMKEIKKFHEGGDHFRNFVQAVRSRKTSDANGEILEGHLSSALCHMGNISYRLGDKIATGEALERVKSVKTKEDVKDTLDRTVSHLAANKVELNDKTKLQVGPWLKFDPKSETFVGNEKGLNDKANAMTTREYRAPFIVPASNAI